jgi:hypothetical protein
MDARKYAAGSCHAMNSYDPVNLPSFSTGSIVINAPKTSIEHPALIVPFWEFTGLFGAGGATNVTFMRAGPSFVIRYIRGEPGPQWGDGPRNMQISCVEPVIIIFPGFAMEIVLRRKRSPVESNREPELITICSPQRACRSQHFEPTWV